MDLKQLTPEQAQKAQFMQKKGSKVEKFRKVFSLGDPDSDATLGMYFGNTGSGKTYLIGQLAAGSTEYNIPSLKILILSTDIGGNGTRTIKAYLKSINKLDLLDNVKVVQADTYDEVDSFLKDPYQGLPDNFEPDLIVWDGFSYFQKCLLQMEVQDDDQLVFEKMDPAWQEIANGTLQFLQRFCAIRKRGGGPVHKLVTCAETMMQKPINSANPMQGNAFVEAYRVNISGKAGPFVLAAFDFIFRCRVKTLTGEEAGKRKYEIVTQGTQNLDAKERGIGLPPELESDACRVMRAALDAYSLNI